MGPCNDDELDGGMKSQMEKEVEVEGFKNLGESSECGSTVYGPRVNAFYKSFSDGPVLSKALVGRGRISILGLWSVWATGSFVHDSTMHYEDLGVGKIRARASMHLSPRFDHGEGRDGGRTVCRRSWELSNDASSVIRMREVSNGENSSDCGGDVSAAIVAYSIEGLEVSAGDKSSLGVRFQKGFVFSSSNGNSRDLSENSKVVLSYDDGNKG